MRCWSSPPNRRALRQSRSRWISSSDAEAFATTTPCVSHKRSVKAKYASRSRSPTGRKATSHRPRSNCPCRRVARLESWTAPAWIRCLLAAVARAKGVGLLKPLANSERLQKRPELPLLFVRQLLKVPRQIHVAGLRLHFVLADRFVERER